MCGTPTPPSLQLYTTHPLPFLKWGGWGSREGRACATHTLTHTHCCCCCVRACVPPFSNVTHMARVHSFFIPDIEYLQDVQGLVLYLVEKVRACDEVLTPK